MTDQQTKEDILKELHQEDNGSNESDEEDLDLGIDKLKMAQKDTPPKEKRDAPVNRSDPISEEKKRHKENLMQDIYDQLSDDDEEDEENTGSSQASQNDNPFQQQLLKDAQELRAKQNAQSNPSADGSRVGDIKE